MTKALLIFILLSVLIISCQTNKVSNIIKLKSDTSKMARQNLLLDNISFDFIVRNNKAEERFIIVDATLSNANTDTVYFLTWTDHGKQYSLRYDTSQFEYDPGFVSNATYPIIEKIPPYGRIAFKADFKCKTKISKIKFGFDFWRVEKDFDIEFNNVTEFDKNRQRTILYTPEKTIE